MVLCSFADRFAIEKESLVPCSTVNRGLPEVQESATASALCRSLKLPKEVLIAGIGGEQCG